MRQDLSGDAWLVRPFLGEEWRNHRAHLPGPVAAGRWWPCAVPGSIVTAATRAGAVPDPYVGTNSRAAEWLADRTLVYRRAFSTPVPGRGQRATIVLEGIDYSGRVFCDGVDLGAHEGEFTPFTADVTDVLASGDEHLLAVVIDPAPASEPQVGRTSTVRVVKTRMSYGWDFCPRLVHQGIWRPAHLDVTGPARITGVRVDPHLLPNGGGRIDVSVDVDGPDATMGTACAVTILGPDGIEVASADATTEPAATWRASVGVRDPQRWWPNGFGAQPLYRAIADVAVAGLPSDRREVTFGIRDLAFRPVTGAPAGSLPYLPVVNGVPVPVRGWNWVPADLAYGAADFARVRHLVRLAAEAGVTLLRVWGGGLIETEEFYDACDAAGILVWQEFVQSSSGMESTPSTDPGFLTRLTLEAEHAIRARRNHPSLAIWCGGNELADAHGQPLDGTHPAIAALAGAACRLDPGRLFLPTSPSGPVFGDDAATGSSGGAEERHDVHGPWEHQGLARQYARYDDETCQLLSEFGVEGMAYRRVLDRVVGEHGLVMPTRGTDLWDHLGRWWNNEALVQESFGGAIAGIDEMSRCSQFLQADGLRYAIEAQRRRWPSCAGTIAWQLNEPFPNAWCTSAVDHTGAPKPAYHAVAAAHAPLHACARLDRQCFDGEERFTADLVVLLDGRPDDPGPGPGDRGADATPVTAMVDVAAVVTDLRGAVLAGRRARVPVTAGQPCLAGTVQAAFADAATSVVMLTVEASVGDVRRSTTRYLVTATQDLRGLLQLPAADLVVSAAAAQGDGGWAVVLRNAGTVAAPFVRVMDGRALPASGWMIPSDSGFHLLPGESATIAVRWAGVPGTQRRLLIDGFNLPAIAVTVQPGGARPASSRSISAADGMRTTGGTG